MGEGWGWVWLKKVPISVSTLETSLKFEWQKNMVYVIDNGCFAPLASTSFLFTALLTLKNI